MIKIAMLGRSEGNGHPYSWSAIFNGYDEKLMAKCPFPVIPEYLGKQDKTTLQIQDARVTHIWAEDKEEAYRIAATSKIENVVERMEDVIGKVDAAIIGMDVGEKHLEMARPFLERGIPLFIDKPLTDNPKHLKEFAKYYREGKPFMSCSSMRYSKELNEVKKNIDKFGEILLTVAYTPKSWAKYGIHALEAAAVISGRGIYSVQNIGIPGKETVILKYPDERKAILNVYHYAKVPIQVTIVGTKKTMTVIPEDAFYAFKTTLLEFVKLIKTGKSPIPYEETLEFSKVIIAGAISLQEGGREVLIKEIEEE
ncbi:Gfo/Idh/MocA family oxidoreductase [Candidatus Aerophobetes bacterium]|nr:Gfo/Idh/MocA family oxidoreductase [Candidatus Aerophobetes bacterium]